MEFEVVVIGGGIGGLTTAALLAKRGLRVGLFERASRVGGCVAPVEVSEYRFDPGVGLFAGWGADEIHARIFAELGIKPPEYKLLECPYGVRLPDGMEVPIWANTERFIAEVERCFPECAPAAVAFYNDLEPIAAALDRTMVRQPDLVTSSRRERAKLIAAEPLAAPRILGALPHTAGYYLSRTSERFRRFVDAQLQLFGLGGADESAFLYAAMALTLPQRGLYEIGGGGAAVASTLEAAVIAHGGEVHCNQTVLRLVRDGNGRAVGIDLLSGERVSARRAVVSNLTAADTYGKLVPLSESPVEVRQKIRSGANWGAYQIFLGVDRTAIGRLATPRIMGLSDWQFGQKFAPQDSVVMLSATTGDSNAPSGRSAVRVSTFTETAPWFEFDADGGAHDALDQAELERWWTLLLGLVPELTESAEVIGTSTPRTTYEDTRRKLGAVGGLGQSLSVFGPNSLTHKTPVPNLFLTGDSVFPGNGVAAVTTSALNVANEISPR